jgi:hypothetical protein
MPTDVQGQSPHPSPQSSTPVDLSGRQREAWLRRMLPWMIGMVFGLTIFFFVASAVQLAYLHYEIKKAPDTDAPFALSEQLLQGASASSKFKAAVGGAPESLPAAAIATLTALERSAMQRRYHQANVLLMSRVWTSYLGFVTGMVLAMVGAIFILGRLEIAASTATVEVAAGKLNLGSSSPGLFMAGFGTVLMIVTIVTHHQISVEDRAIYTQGWSLGSAAGSQPAGPREIGSKEPIDEATDAGVAPPPNLGELEETLGGGATPQDASTTCPPTCNEGEP